MQQKHLWMSCKDYITKVSRVFMATQKKIVEMIASVKTIYPYYAKEATNIEVLVKTWGLLLNDFPDAIVEVAFLKCLQICKMPPTPADVIEQIKAIHTANETSEEELWMVYMQALKDTSTYVYRTRYPLYGEDPWQKIEELWQGLPGEIRRYVGSKSELMRYSRSFTDEDLQYEKTRFLKAMPTLREREEYVKLAALTTGENTMIGIEEKK